MRHEGLRSACDHGQYDAHTFLSPGGDPESSIAYQQCPGGRPVTDAELASLGWVRLDRLDAVIALGEGLAANGIEDVNVLVSVARKVLAALDQENTDAS